MVFFGPLRYSVINHSGNVAKERHSFFGNFEIKILTRTKNIQGFVLKTIVTLFTFHQIHNVYLHQENKVYFYSVKYLLIITENAEMHYIHISID